MKKYKSLFILSIFKYLFLFYVSFVIKKNLTSETANSIIVLLKKIEIVNTVFQNYYKELLILLGFGIVLNLFIIFFLSESKSRFLSFVMGIIKVLTLSIISGLTLVFNSFTPVEKPISNKQFSNNFTQNNEQNINKNIKENEVEIKWLNSKRYNKTSPIAGISVILFILILIGCYIISGMFHPFFAIAGLVLGIVWLIWFNKKKVFKNRLKKIRYGMSIEEVKYIMKNVKIDREGYTKSGYYIIAYEIFTLLNHGDYEKEVFYFEDNKLVDRDSAYKRTTTKSW